MPEKTLGRFGIASILHQNIDHFATLLDGAPEPNELSVDLAAYLVEILLMPAAASTLTRVPGVRTTEYQTPAAEGFVRD